MNIGFDMLILVCGDRNWSDRATIKRVLALLPVDAVVMHGDCRGADKIAGEEASRRGLTVKAFPADWSLGRRAGPIRNRQMLDQKPDIVIAFHPDLKTSRGTQDTVGEAKKRNIRVVVYTRG